MRFDLVIIGMGSGGMVAAELAATLGLRVAVVERSRVGGDCLWTGCVPSKALIASARVAHVARHAALFGIEIGGVEVDGVAVWRRIRDVRQQIATTDDDPGRYRAMGIDVVMGVARVTAPDRVSVELTGGGTRVLTTRYVLVCTGSRPRVPDVAGLVDVGFVSSEDVFELERPPASFVVLGGGPIAVELAQACNRLGIAVTVLQRGCRLLPRDEAGLAARLTGVLAAEGVEIHLATTVERVTVVDGRKVVHGTTSGVARRWEADEVLVAAGRAPNVEELGLEALGVVVGADGVAVDDRGRSAVRTIYAAGDVVGRARFTHAAAYEGVRAVRDAFFPGSGRVDAVIPWCTFTDPELAHVGLTTAQAVESYGGHADVHRFDLSRSDRARADGAAGGEIVVVTVKGRVVGAHMLAPSAGEIVHELALAVQRRMRLTELASLVHVYPTMATAVGQLAAETAFVSARRWRWLATLGRWRLTRR
jgi:pyruvate/2-oxoglutarate dehydrogenase complex dihydrolipoamide dehydrogenase (E3) component